MREIKRSAEDYGITCKCSNIYPHTSLARDATFSICKVQTYMVNNVTILTTYNGIFPNCSSNGFRRTSKSYFTGSSVFIGKCTFKPWRWLIGMCFISHSYTSYNEIKSCYCRIGSLQPKLEEDSKSSTWLGSVDRQDRGNHCYMTKIR